MVPMSLEEARIMKTTMIIVTCLYSMREPAGRTKSPDAHMHEFRQLTHICRTASRNPNSGYFHFLCMFTSHAYTEARSVQIAWPACLPAPRCASSLVCNTNIHTFERLVPITSVYVCLLLCGSLLCLASVWKKCTYFGFYFFFHNSFVRAHSSVIVGVFYIYPTCLSAAAFEYTAHTMYAENVYTHGTSLAKQQCRKTN